MTPLRGGSSATNASLGNWQWLSSSKSFHDMQKLNQAPAATPSTRRQNTQRKAVARYLDHLETLLPRYCQHLAHPTYKEAADAMSLLLRSPPPIPILPRNLKPADYSPESPEKRMPTRRKENEGKKNVDMKSLLSSPFRSRRLRQNKLLQVEQEKPSRWGRNLSSGSQYASSATSPSSLSMHNSSAKPNPKYVVTNKLDEAAWQEFVSPFVLLAGAEAIYADLEQVHPTPSIIHWSGIYQRISSELLHMLPPPPPDDETKRGSAVSPRKEDPSKVMASDILPSSPQSPPSTPRCRTPPNLSPRSKSASMLFPSVLAAIATGEIALTTPTRTNASSSPADQAKMQKYQCLRSLSSWLEFKCQWIPFHESLYLTWSSDNLMFLRAFAAALPPPEATEQENDQVSSTSNECGQPLMESLRQEIQTTLSLMEMAFWLERGR